MPPKSTPAEIVEIAKKRIPHLWHRLATMARRMPHRGAPQERPNPFSVALAMPGVIPSNIKQQIPRIAMDHAQAVKLAMDSASDSSGAWMGGYGQNYFESAYEEGQVWLGYAVLALLSQRAEYRLMTDTIATEMTREWISFKSKSDDKSQNERIEQIERRLRELDLRNVIKLANLNDGFQGRGQVYIDTCEPDDREELKLGLSNLDVVKAKYGEKKKFIRRLSAVEPMWCYPAQYDATDPLNVNWYKPEYWWVMGKEVHKDRLLTFVGNPVPDMLKPAYSFGGLSLSQMAKPYVDFWLRNRTSESDLLNNFSVMVLSTNLDVSTMDEGGELFQRASLFNTLRDNQALMMIDKNTEDFKNVTASLGGVSDIVRQSMERLTLPSQIPVVKFFGDQPAGLSATSEGVIRMFYDGIKAKQEARNRKVIQQIVELVQIELFGEVIDDIEWTFNDLWQLDEAGKAGIQKTKADTRAVDLEAGLITPEEGREVLARDPDSQYTGLDLSEPIPQQPQEGEEDLSDEEGGTTPAEGATPHPGASGSAPQQPGEPKLSPSKRDFASSVTSAAAKFGGAATNGLPAKDKDLGLDEELGEDKKAFEWEEELHPRDESGKFAPKGNASISLHKMLLSKGFQQHPESPHAIYTHSSGHQIAFAPKSVHNAHSYQFAAYKDFKKHPDKLQTSVQGTTKHMEEMLGKLGLNSTPQAKPVNEMSDNEILQELAAFKLLHPPEAKLSTVKTESGLYIPADYKKIESGFSSIEAYTIPNSDKKLLIKKATGFWIIEEKNNTIKKGTGQEELNAAFEALHPRDAQGHFIAKFKTEDGTVITMPPGFEPVSNSENEPYFKVPNSKNTLEMYDDGSWRELTPSGHSVKTGNNQDDLNKAYGVSTETKPESTPTPVSTFKDKLTDKQIPSYAKKIESNNIHTKYELPNDSVLTVYWDDDWQIYDKNGDLVELGVGSKNGQEFLDKALQKAVGNSETEAATPPATSYVPPAVNAPLTFSDMKKVGEKLGSNPGGTYEDASGKKYYVKMPKSNDHTKNELLAASLFRAAGGDTLKYHPINDGDKEYVGTEWEPTEKNNMSQLTPAERKQAQKDFALHAWLANWDAAGLTGDNVGVTKDGQVLPLDFGGSLLYRAQGGQKGNLFDNDATEFDTLRNPNKNPSAAKLYGDMTPAEIKESTDRLKNITATQIYDLVQKYGPGGKTDKKEMVSKLILRRNALIAKGDGKPAPKPASESNVKQVQPALTQPNPKDNPWHQPDYKAVRDKVAAWNPPNKPLNAIQGYKGIDYTPMNQIMRVFSFKSIAKRTDSYSKANMEIHDWLNKASTQEEVKMFRGIPSCDYNKALIEHAQVGNEIPWEGFSSMSTSEDFSRGWAGKQGSSSAILYRVVVPKGSKVATVRSENAHDTENEAIAQHGAHFIVTKKPYKDGGVYIIEGTLNTSYLNS